MYIQTHAKQYTAESAYYYSDQYVIYVSFPRVDVTHIQWYWRKNNKGKESDKGKKEMIKEEGGGMVEGTEGAQKEEAKEERGEDHFLW